MSSSSSYCGQCLRQLPAESADGLCPACRESVATGSVRVLAPAAPDTLSSHQTGFAPTTVPIRVGRPLPPAPPGYVIEKELGFGGMGAVYLAVETAAERRVAMKFLNAPGHPTALDRFLVEVKALARLDHPNIVRVLAIDVYRPDPYFTMEYLAGGSLADRVRAGPLAPAEAAALIRDVARAVGVAHAAGILHRDLKPGNILLTEVRGPRSEVRSQNSTVSDPKTGTSSDRGPLTSDFSGPALCPKVSDFGLARLIDQGDHPTPGTGALGTPGYMPPEQVSRRYGEVGPASDVYGLGATLYHLLTGRPPFTGDSNEDTVTKLVADPLTRPRSVRPDVPPTLEAVVVRCLEKRPQDRYPAADAVADDLQRFLDGQRPTAPELTRWRRTRRWCGRNRPALAAAAAVLLLAAGMVAVGRWSTPPARVIEPPPLPDPVAEMRAELQAGRAVTLVGATGLPRWHRAVLEPTTVGPSSLGDGTASFHAFNVGLVELFPDPGVDRYAVSLEIRQLESKPEGKPGDIEYVGLYFGYSTGRVADGSPAHSYFAVTFKDYPMPPRPERKPPPAPVPDTRRRTVMVQQFDLFQSGDRLVSSAPGNLLGQPFTPAPTRPGEWRPVTVEVTPDGALVKWRADPTPAGPGRLETLKRLLPAAELRDKYARLAREKGPSNALPDWSPRMPLGVTALKSVVAFRNVVIRPLP